jgi:hypothetical protein
MKTFSYAVGTTMVVFRQSISGLGSQGICDRKAIFPDSMYNKKALGGNQGLGWVYHGLVGTGRLGFNSKLLCGPIRVEIRGGFWISRGSEGVSSRRTKNTDSGR